MHDDDDTNSLLAQLRQEFPNWTVWCDSGCPWFRARYGEKFLIALTSSQMREKIQGAEQGSPRALGCS